MNRKFTILSIDGGGIRGMIPAIVLAELERELKKKHPKKALYDHFDLICGTSTGAILALAVALGVPAEKLIGFYKENAAVIFPKWYLKLIPRKIRAIITSIYSNKQLRNKLVEVYSAQNNGTPPLMDELKTNVCIPSFNGNDGEINVFKTKHHPEYFRDYKIPVHEVALASASAPVYFPPHSFRFENKLGSGTNVNMIDGGIFANNPSLIGVFEGTEKLGHPFSDIRILSLGTGKGRHIIKTSWKPKNIWYWLFPKPRLLDMVLDSQAQITEQYLVFLQKAIAKQGETFEYLRVQHDLGTDTIDLNTSDKRELDRLESIGNELTKNNLTSILKFLNV